MAGPINRAADEEHRRAIIEAATNGDDQWYTKGNKFNEAFRRNTEDNPQMDAYAKELASMVPGVMAAEDVAELKARVDAGEDVPWYLYAAAALPFIPAGALLRSAGKARKMATIYRENASKAKRLPGSRDPKSAKEWLEKANIAEQRAFNQTGRAAWWGGAGGLAEYNAWRMNQEAEDQQERARDYQETRRRAQGR